MLGLEREWGVGGSTGLALLVLTLGVDAQKERR